MSDDKNHITRALEFQRYLEGKMSPKERHEFEKRLLEDDFENEASEGFARLSPGEMSADMEKLRMELGSKSRTSRSNIYWRAAAAIALLGVFSFAVYTLIDLNSPGEIAQSKKAPANTRTEKPEADSLSFIDTTALSTQPVITFNQDIKTGKKESAPLKRPLQKGPELPDSGAAIVESMDFDTEVNDFIMEEIAQKPALEPAMEMADEIVPPQPARQAELVQSRESIAAGTAGANAAMSRSASKSQNTRTIKGKVVSAEDEEGLPGVNIVLKGSATGTISDFEGNYSIKVPASEDVVLVYSSVGFISEEIAVRDGGEMNIAMETDITSLSEIVVIGYGTQAKKDLTGAISTVDTGSQNTYAYIPPMPAGGNSSFKTYVKENMRYPVSGLEQGIRGTVRLKFTVGKDSQISNIEILKSLGDDFDREAIRLLREGPKWEPARENDTAVEKEVKIRIQFRPQE